MFSSSIVPERPDRNSVDGAAHRGSPWARSHSRENPEPQRQVSGIDAENVALVVVDPDGAEAGREPDRYPTRRAALPRDDRCAGRSDRRSPSPARRPRAVPNASARPTGCGSPSFVSLLRAEVDPGDEVGAASARRPQARLVDGQVAAGRIGKLHGLDDGVRGGIDPHELVPVRDGHPDRIRPPRSRPCARRSTRGRARL